MTTDDLKPGMQVRLTAPGALYGIKVWIDQRIGRTSRFRIIAAEGRWNGQPFTASADFLERVA